MRVNIPCLHCVGEYLYNSNNYYVSANVIILYSLVARVIMYCVIVAIACVCHNSYDFMYIYDYSGTSVKGNSE